MNVCSAWFLAFCCLGPILFHAWHSRGVRQVLLTLFNAAFLYFLLSDWRSAFCLALFVLVGYFITRALSPKSPPVFIFSAIAGFVVVFIYVKHYAFLDWIFPSELLLQPLAVVGLSYILFKTIHVFVDQWQGTLAPCSFWAYVNYQLSFFTITAGPIQRFNDFQKSWEEMDLSPEDAKTVLQSWTRLLGGMIKVGALAPFAWSYFDQGSQSLLAGPAPNSLGQFSSLFYGYPIYLYLNFSGYTSIVIGAGRLFGFRLPENFNAPYLGRNIIEFWNRWHMTLTHWIRDYVFMTSYKAVAERFPRQSRVAGPILAFTSLLIAGVWHGAASGFAVFGIIHGLGAAANQMGTDMIKTSQGAAGLRRYQQNKFIHAAALLFTWHYLGFSFLFFSLGTHNASIVLANAAYGILHADGLSEFLTVGLCLLAAFALVVALLYAEKILQRAAAMIQGLYEGPRFLYWLMLSETVFVAGAFFFSYTIGQGDPVVVYVKF